MSDKKPSRPAWWKNTYFWIAGLLVVIGIYGLIGGQDSIRDPGQKRENGLVIFYLGAAAIMLVNGMLSHLQTVRHYEETVNESNE